MFSPSPDRVYLQRMGFLDSDCDEEIATVLVLARMTDGKGSRVLISRKNGQTQYLHGYKSRWEQDKICIESPDVDEFLGVVMRCSTMIKWS